MTHEARQHGDQILVPIQDLQRAEAERDALRAALEAVVELIESLPSGIDCVADSADLSPDDMTAHIGGLIWQECQAALGIEEE